MTTLWKAFEDFLKDLEANGMSERTLNWHRVQSSLFIQKFSGRDVNQFDHDTLRDHVTQLRKQSKSVWTARAKINALIQFWLWASKRYEIKNPMIGLRRPKIPEAKPKAIERDHLVALFNATSPDGLGYRDRAMLIFMADTGCRSAGVRGLKIADLDFSRRRAIVCEKGDRLRSVPFTKTTMRILLQWINRMPSTAIYVFCTKDGDQMGDTGIRQCFNRLAKKAGIEGRHNPHSFRHFAGREYLKNGGDLATAARILGHRDVTTTARFYAVFDDDELQDRHDKHSPLMGIFKRKDQTTPEN
jgi:site-specific recombinase XerD